MINLTMHKDTNCSEYSKLFVSFFCLFFLLRYAGRVSEQIIWKHVNYANIVSPCNFTA